MPTERSGIIKPETLVPAADLASAEPLNLSDRMTLRNWLAIPFFSVVLIIPCWWQSRIQSADLSSHIYNAWLATQIRQGKLPGLWISPQSSNILFDVLLEWLLVHVGADLAQRIAVSLSVLVFGWGALLFIFRLAGKNWWFAAPTVAMLSYGFIFHIGLFNFYLSMALCLWYLSLFWGANWKIRAAITPLLLVAWLAHPLPVVWAIGTAAYTIAATRVQRHGRIVLLICGLVVLIVTRFILDYHYTTAWSFQQFFFITGANQLSLFGAEYTATVAGVLLVWLMLFRRLLKGPGGMERLLTTIPFELCVLNAAGTALIPDRVLFPQFGRPLAFIADRLSLGAALMICALLAAIPLTRFEKLTLVVSAALFFGCLYADDRDLNRQEDRIDALVTELPPGQRVLTPLPSQSLRSLCFQHDVDRACIGRCYSYANYEASSGQFRIRALPKNGTVLDSYADVDAVASGTYVVRLQDVPSRLIYACGMRSRIICSQPLHPDDRIDSVIRENSGEEH